MDFGKAIEAAKSGKKVARIGWNGVGMFAYIVPAASYPAQTGVAKEYFGENADSYILLIAFNTPICSSMYSFCNGVSLPIKVFSIGTFSGSG